MLLLGSYRISWDCTLDLSSQCVKMSRFNDNSVLVMIITILFVTFQDIVNLSRVKRTKSGVPEQDKGCHLGSAQIFVRTSMARASEHNVNASARINKCWYDRVQECPTRISVTSLSQKRAFSAAIRISPRVQNEGSARCYKKRMQTTYEICGLATTLLGNNRQSCLINLVHIILRIPYSKCNT